MQLDLTDEEGAALLRELSNLIENDRYPLSPRIRLLRRIPICTPLATAIRRRPITVGTGKGGIDRPNENWKRLFQNPRMGRRVLSTLPRCAAVFSKARHATAGPAPPCPGLAGLRDLLAAREPSS
jgi:hypothetical protein